MLFSSIAYAQEATGGPSNALVSFAPFIVIILVFYFLIIRPNQKRQKQQSETLNSLKAGDVVMTTSGFIATIESVIDANSFMINLGNGVKVRIVKGGISGKYTEPTQQAAQGGSPVGKK